MKHEFINLKNKGYKFHIIAELQQIEKLISDLPKENEVHFLFQAVILHQLDLSSLLQKGQKSIIFLYLRCVWEKSIYKCLTC